MFSGIVEEIGVVSTMARSMAGARVSILAKSVLNDLQLGESVSVSGTCLTVVTADEHAFSADISTETLQVTTLGGLKAGVPVNLERAMKLNERIGGHLVTGHIDGIGVIHERQLEGNTLLLHVEAPEEIVRYCIRKGSITVDGVSLTVNHVGEKGFSVAIIPHTASVTTLGKKGKGDLVNLESDLVGKYVERLLQGSGHLPARPSPVIDRDYLKKHGLM